LGAAPKPVNEALAGLLLRMSWKRIRGYALALLVLPGTVLVFVPWAVSMLAAGTHRYVLRFCNFLDRRFQKA